MKLTFKKIIIKNFMSFNDISFDFDELHGMTLITGKNNDIPGSKNGAGKSNLSNALVYALFGELPNKVNKLNIPNRIFPITEEVKLELFFLAKDTLYKVVRGLTKKYRSTYCQLYKYDKDNNEIDLTKSSISLTQTFLETEILKTDISLFLRAILLSTDQTYNFFKLNAGQKKEFVENLFGLDFYTNIFNRIHRDNLDTEKDINILVHDQLNLTSSLEDYNKKSNDFISRVELKKEETKNKLNELNEKSKLLNSSLIDISNKIESTTLLSNKINDSLDKLYSYKNSLTLKNVELTNKYNNNIKVIKLKSDFLLSHNKVQEKLCSSCKTVYDNIFSLEDIKSQINSLEISNSKITPVLQEIKTKLEAINQKYDLVLSKKNTLYNDLNTLSNKKQNTTNNIFIVNQQISSLNNIEDIQNPYLKIIDDTKEKLKNISDEIKEKENNLKYLSFAEGIVSQDTIKKFIIKDMLGVLNTRIAYYLNKLGARYTCEFDNNLDYTFITDTGTTDYNNFSSGERTRLSIATSFAFRDFMATRSGVSSNILILDEYLDSNLDSLAISGIISILKEFLVLYDQRIYIISHRSEVDSSMFNNEITVEKTNGISKIIINRQGI